MTTLKQFELQKQIKENSQELVNKVNELHKWEKEMKRNSAEICQTKKNENSYPIRSHKGTSNGHSKANETATTRTKENNGTTSLTDANVYKDLGNKCFKNNDHETAIKNYTKAIEIKDDPVFYTNRAICFLKLERYKDCIDDCSKALQLDPTWVKGYYRRMQANEVLCNFVSALKDCKEILKIDPKNSDAVEASQRLTKRIADLTPSPSSSNEITWSKLDASVKDVAFIKKPPHLRSKKPLRRIQINAPLSTNPPDKKSKDEENEAFKSAEGVVDQSNQIDCATDKVLTMLPLKSPNSSAQFYQTWRELSDNRQKYSFLKIIDVTSLNKLLGSQFDSEMLKDLLNILSQNFVIDSIPVTGILKQIILNDEFKILKMFMDTEDKNAFEKLLKYVESNETNPNDLTFIKDKYFN